MRKKNVEKLEIYKGVKKDTIKGCEGSTDFGLHRLTVVSADLLGKPVEKKYEPYNHPDLKHSLGKIVEFPLWKDYHSSLPIELQWLESSKPGSVQFCFRKFNMIKLTIDTRKANPNHRAQFDIIVEVQFEGQTVLTSHFKPDIRHNWVYTVPSYGFPNPPAISTDIYKLYWNGAKEVTPIDKSMHFGFSGIVENNYKEATSWGNTFVENEVGMTFARATLLKNMESVKAEVIKDATSTEQFQIKRKALSEIRNALNIMIELGINSTSPERTLAQSKLYSLSRLSVETSSIERKANRELRELDVIMQQIMNGDYQTEEVLAQIDDASEEMITYFKKMNASGRDLCPVNRIIDTTLRDLRYLLRPEFKKAN